MAHDEPLVSNRLESNGPPLTRQIFRDYIDLQYHGDLKREAENTMTFDELVTREWMKISDED